METSGVVTQIITHLLALAVGFAGGKFCFRFNSPTTENTKVALVSQKNNQVGGDMAAGDINKNSKEK